MNAYSIAVLALLVFGWALDWTVERLNLHHASPDLPPEFADAYDAERYARSQRYLRETTLFGLFRSTVMLAATIVFLLAGGFRWLHGLAVSFSDNTIAQGLAFAGALLMISLLAGLPFEGYRTFVIEERFGFNRTTPRTFVLDRVKGLALSALIGAPLFALILWLFETFAGAWLWAWSATNVFQTAVAFVAPVAILPLFNKFAPLEEGELRSRLSEYAANQRYRLGGVFTIDGSRRSTKTNAYFTGFGKTKRIALFDTLVARHSTDELVAVLAHEVGHAKLGHVGKRIALGWAASLPMFAGLAFFLPRTGLYEGFGVEGTPIYVGFALFGFLYAPASLLLGIAGNVVSRRHEYAADAFAARTTGRPEALATALKKLSAHNLGNLTPHPLKVFLEYSHPPVIDRIRALAKAGETT